MEKFFAVLGKDNKEIDAREAEENFRAEHPILQADEHIDLAFKVGRDKLFFTDRRVLSRDKEGLTGTKLKYKSVPYSGIRAFAVQTAGAYLDNDSEVLMWTELPGLGASGCIEKHFLKDQADVFQIQSYLCGKVMGTAPGPERLFAEQPPIAEKPPDATGDVFAWLGNDAAQVDATEIDRQLHTEPAILQQDEHIELAFKVGRDTTLMSTKRLIMVDVKGMSGAKIEYLSIPYESIRAFAIETAGSWDADASITIWTCMPGKTEISQDLRKGHADVFAIQTLLSARVLGSSPAPARVLPPAAARGKGYSKGGEEKKEKDDGIGAVLAWLGDDMSEIHPEQIDQQLHTSPPILQGDEHIELAFKVGRDVMTFTAKRILWIDVKGWTGKKVEYLSLPYTSIQAFGLMTGGGWRDLDSHLQIWTEIRPPPHAGDGPPPMGLSFLQQDLRKSRVDVFAIQKLLAAKVLSNGSSSRAVLPPRPASDAAPVASAEGFMAWLGNDAQEISVEEADRQFRTSPALLEEDEQVDMAFKVWRDTILLTSKRIVIVDVKGKLWSSGKNMAIYSIPYSSVHGFAVESAGTWDADAELNIWTRMPALPVVHQDFRKGKVDILAVNSVLSARVLGGSRPMAAHHPAAPGTDTGSAGTGGSLEETMHWLDNNATQIDAAAVDERLHTTNPVLDGDEHVQLAFKVGRDMTLLTTKRILQIDVKGWSGQKIEYKSTLYTKDLAFKVESAGSWDLDAEMKVWTQMPGMPAIGQDLRKGKADIFALQDLLAAHILQKH